MAWELRCYMPDLRSSCSFEITFHPESGIRRGSFGSKVEADRMVFQIYSLERSLLDGFINLTPLHYESHSDICSQNMPTIIHDGTWAEAREIGRQPSRLRLS